MIGNFNEEAEEVLIKAKLEMLELRHPYIGTEHLVLAILHTKNEISQKLENYDITYDRFKKEIIKIIGKGSKKSTFFLHTPLLKKVIENAIMDSKENNNGIVTISHLFLALMNIEEGIAIRILIGMNIDLDEIYDELTKKDFENKTEKKLLIEELGININDKAKRNEIDPVIGRDEEIKQLEEILCRRTKNNPLLIGAPGVGKTAIVEGLATLIENNNVPKKLQNKIIISLDMASAVAGTKYRGEFEERMKKIIAEIENNSQIILFIDEIHTLIGAGGAEGAIDASNILKPALARGKIRCIGATTIEEYQKHFEKDKALERRFQTIKIEEPTIEETKNILYSIKPVYEKFHNVTIEDELINQMIELSEKYLHERFRPDKEIDILDEACSKSQMRDLPKITKYNHSLKELRDKKEISIKENNIKKAYEYKIKETKLKDDINSCNKRKNITIEDLAYVINRKTKIPIDEILKKNYKSINEYRNTLKEKIIGQEEAITKIINIIKRIKLGYRNNSCVSLLFIGPSGTGKTLLAEYIGTYLSNKKVIKIDMAEYSDASSISKFIGSNAGYIGYDDNNYILNTIKNNPHALIVLDNIDKANHKIIDLLNQILEESQIKDAKNNTIHFNNNIIIMTTNAISSEKNIGYNNKKKKGNNLKDIFNISFINRIDNIIEFNKLNKQHITKIISKELKKVTQEYANIKITINKKIIDEIINESEYQSFGARKIKKIIQDRIENIIIDNIINDKKEINIDSIFV